MELQHLSPPQTTPEGYTKLLDDEADSSAQPLPEKQEARSSHVHQRAIASEQNDQLSTSEGLPQKQVKELGACFRIFYYTLLTTSILGSVGNLIYLICAVFDGLELDKIEMVYNAWQVVQCVVAFSGVKTRSLRRISNAFFMMKISCFLLGIVLLVKELEVNNKAQRRKNEDSEPHFLLTAVVPMILYPIIFLWPTWRVKKIFESLPSGYNHVNEEQIRQEQAQGEDPIERLGSIWFKLYKYGLLLLFCMIMKSFVSGAIENFSDIPRFFQNLKSHPSFLMGVVGVFISFILRSLFVFFVFEGFRRQSLEKMVTAIKIMKTSIWVGLICDILKEIALSREGRFMESERKIFAEYKINPDWLLPVSLATKLLVVGSLSYFVFLFGALKARNILKAHLEIKRTL